MENVTDALKMAGAMLIFVGAITITIIVFSKARDASTEIMAQADRNKTFYNLDNINLTSEREVGVDTIISNIYSYYQTQNTLLFYTGSLDSGGNLISITPMSLYVSEAFPNTLAKSSLVIEHTSNIFGLDINDEAIREEQWVNGETRRKQFVDLLLNRDNDTVEWMRNNRSDPKSIFNSSIDRAISFNYLFDGESSFLDLKDEARFIERVGEYNRDLETSDAGDKTDEGDVVGQFNGLVIDSSVIRFQETDETFMLKISSY